MNHSSNGGSNPGRGEEVSQGSDHTLPDFFLGMRLVENRLHTIQDHDNPRASRFSQLGPECREQRFDVMPINVGANRVREEPFEDSLLFLRHRSSWAESGAFPGGYSTIP
jgi:hypothetical protein